MIWPLFAYRRRGRRIDPGPAIPSADRERQGFCRWRRCGGGGPHGGGGSHGGGPAGRAIMAEVLQCHVFARPDFAMGGPHGSASRSDSGRPARRRSSAFRDGWTAWRRRASRNPAAPRNAVSTWEAGAPRSAASRWEAAANPWLGAIARCSRTGSSNPSPSRRESANFRSLSGSDHKEHRTNR